MCTLQQTTISVPFLDHFLGNLLSPYWFLWFHCTPDFAVHHGTSSELRQISHISVMNLRSSCSARLKTKKYSTSASHNLIWWFPKIGVIIHFSGIFRYKPSIYWGTPISGKPPYPQNLTISQTGKNYPSPDGFCWLFSPCQLDRCPWAAKVRCFPLGNRVCLQIRQQWAQKMDG